MLQLLLSKRGIKKRRKRRLYSFSYSSSSSSVLVSDVSPQMAPYLLMMACVLWLGCLLTWWDWCVCGCCCCCCRPSCINFKVRHFEVFVSLSTVKVVARITAVAAAAAFLAKFSLFIFIPFSETQFAKRKTHATWLDKNKKYFRLCAISLVPVYC